MPWSGDVLHILGDALDNDETVRKVTAVFDAWADAGRAEGMERGHGPHARQAFEMLGLEGVQGPLRYLDIGCGNGYTVRWAAELVRARSCGGLAVGLDGSARMVDRARAQSAGLPARFVHTAFPAPVAATGDVAELLVSSCYDAVFSMEVFYYLPDLAAGLADVVRLLKPGGRFACVVDFYAENPASHGWPEMLDVPMTLCSMAQWREAFVAAGLDVVDQQQLTVPPGEGVEAWKAQCGSLLTLGQRPS